MTVAIQTRYIGPSNYRGARIVAETMDTRHDDKKVRKTFDWNHAANVPTNHRNAALALAKSLNWSGQWVMGNTDKGYVFVRTFPGEFEFEVEKTGE